MKPRVLYVTSRFPKLSETFVVNELDALTPRFDLRLAALARTGESPLDDVTRELLARAWFVPRLSPRVLLAHGRWLWRAPRRYLGMWRALARDLTKTGLADAAKTIVVVVQAARLAELAVDARIDHVHAHFANHPATAAWVVHRLTGVPFSFTAHANDLFRTPALLDRKTADAAFVVAISEYNRKLLLERRKAVSAAPVHVVHCGVDIGRFTPDSGGAPVSSRRVICVARFETKKGHRDLLAAFAKIADARSDVGLTLIGDGPGRAAIEALAGTLGIAERVEFVGACSPAEVRAQLTTAALFVLPAVRDDTGRMDGIPVALMEAMAAGVPVVTTSVSGIPELVGDDGGVLVAPSDPDAVAAAMAHVLDDDGFARGLAARGRERVARDFDLHREAAKLGDLFAAAIAGAG